MSETLAEAAGEEAEDTELRDRGSLAEVREDRPDISPPPHEGTGDCAAEPAEPKLESKLTSEPEAEAEEAAECWERVRLARLCEAVPSSGSPDLEWQCFSILTHPDTRYTGSILAGDHTIFSVPHLIFFAEYTRYFP